MRRRLWFLAGVFSILFCGLLATLSSNAQDSKVMGEVQFKGATKVERDAGVWVDGEYLGYVKELKGNKKVLLLPGKHQITVRQSGYGDSISNIVVEPGQTQIVNVKMSLVPGAVTPKVTSQLKLTIQPARAAVFLDGNYIGHAGELGGSVHSLLVSPGTHHIKVELPGYRTFETDVTLLAGQKSEVKTELVKGSIEQAGSEIKKPQ
jgi:PEGA domain